MTESSNNPERDSTAHVTELMRGPLALTPVTAGLILTNLLVFAAMLANGAGLWHSPNTVQLAWGAGFGPATKDGEWWRLGTAMFLHFGLVHLGMNMWALWDGGRLVERMYGSSRFAALFLASGLTGNLLSLIVAGDRAVSGGASGAIFGVYGALLVWLWRERHHVDPTEFRWLFGGAALFSAVTIGFGLMITGVDNAAHIGGLASGALLGVALARPRAGSVGAKSNRSWIAAVVYAVLVAVLIARIPDPLYRWKEELQARSEVRDFLATDQLISQRWQELISAGKRGSATFDELAGRIESDITMEYQQSFEQLSALNLDAAAPSAETVAMLKRYAQLRSEASHLLAEGIRLKNQKMIDEALEKARQAPYLARGLKPPPPLPAR